MSLFESGGKYHNNVTRTVSLPHFIKTVTYSGEKSEWQNKTYEQIQTWIRDTPLTSEERSGYEATIRTDYQKYNSQLREKHSQRESEIVALMKADFGAEYGVNQLPAGLQSALWEYVWLKTDYREEMVNVLGDLEAVIDAIIEATRS